MAGRLFKHSILLDRRSRFLLVSFFLYMVATTAWLWMKFNVILLSAEIDQLLMKQDFFSLLLWLQDPIVRSVYLIAGVLVGGKITATQVVGPARRIEAWMRQWEDNHRLEPLRPRVGDIYGQLIGQLNDLHRMYLKKKR